MGDSLWVQGYQLLGDTSGKEFSEAILRNYSHLAITAALSDKVNQCLGDGQQHSTMLMLPHNEGQILVIVHVHPGDFHEIAPSLHGTITWRLSFFPVREFTAVVMFDVFLEDLEDPTLISVAISFFPIKASKVPTDCQVVLFHREMLSTDELQQLNELYSG